MILLFVFVFNWHLKTIFFRPLLKSKTWKAVCKWHHVEVRWVIFFFLMVSSLLCYIVAWCTGLSPGPCLAPGSPGHCSLCVCVRWCWVGQVERLRGLSPSLSGLPCQVHTVWQKNKLCESAEAKYCWMQKGMAFSSWWFEYFDNEAKLLYCLACVPQFL